MKLVLYGNDGERYGSVAVNVPKLDGRQLGCVGKVGNCACNNWDKFLFDDVRGLIRKGELRDTLRRSVKLMRKHKTKGRKRA